MFQEKIYDSSKTCAAVPKGKNSTKFIVTDESESVLDKVSNVPSNLSTTVVSTISESDNATDWVSSNSTKYKIGFIASFGPCDAIPVADGEKLKKAPII